MTILIIIIRWLIITVAILLSSFLIPGISVNALSSALLAAGLLGIINVFIKPILMILTLPLTIITLGLFSFIINAFLLKLVDYFVAGFKVEGFWAALLGALVISFVNWFANRFIVRRKNGSHRSDKSDYIDLHRRDNGRWE